MVNGEAKRWAAVDDGDPRESRQRVGEHPQATRAAGCSRKGEARHKAASQNGDAKHAWPAS